MSHSEIPEGRKYNLADIIRELTAEEKKVWTTEAGLRERFRKLMEFLNTDNASFKEATGELFFYEGEKELLKSLLIEMGEPYLSRIVSKRRLAKGLIESRPEALAFKERMIKVLSTTDPSPEAREYWLGVIELLSRDKLTELFIQFKEKIEKAYDSINKTDIDYSDALDLLREVNQKTDSWIENRILSRIKKP